LLGGMQAEGVPGQPSAQCAHLMLRFAQAGFAVSIAFWSLRPGRGGHGPRIASRAAAMQARCTSPSP
jgi:hypothetical protein